MRIDYIKINKITFHYVAYNKSLKDSLLRVGQNFPIYIKRNEDGYVCRDGHKRLSAIHDILKENQNYERFQTINVIIEDGARTAPPYHLHNHH